MATSKKQNGHAEILSRLLTGDRDYALTAMYIEYENVASPGDAAVNPSFTEEEGIEYFSNLSGSLTHDFLRVPIRGTTLGLSAGYEGAAYNLARFIAVTEGTAGIHGKAFSSAANSKICGAALVAAPVWADRSQDVIFSRWYYDASEQLLKPASGQVTVQIDEEF